MEFLGGDMNKINMDVFYDKVIDLIDVLYDKEHNNIVKAAEICVKSVENNGVIHVFGSGHSVGFGLEMQDRIGSLACVHSIKTSDFVVKGDVSLTEFKDPNNIFERRPGIAEKLYNLYEIEKRDVFIIISNSGINGVVIDLAIIAKEKGHKIVVVTSLKHTTAEDSRHPSGKKLYELADVVIDNCGPQGDALIETGKVEKICSVSSITGAFIAQTITTETCRILQEKNVDAPIFWDETLNDGIKHNQELREKYKGRI